MAAKEKKYKLGLVLSGGGAWGFAHIGLIRALEELNIVPDIIAGTSMGALIGALYADGYSSQEIIKLTEQIKYSKFATMHLPTRGLLEMSWPEKLLSSALHASTFEELKIPLVVAATNLTKGEITYFNSGTLLDKIIASSSVPIIFNPIEIEGCEYIDGGVLDNFPVRSIRNDCEIIIGMNIEPSFSDLKLKNLLQIANQLLCVFMRSQDASLASHCDIFIEPDVKQYHFFKLTRAKQIAMQGYEAALKALGNFSV